MSGADRVAELVEGFFGRPADQGRSLALRVDVGGDVVAERFGVRPADDFRPELRVDADTPLLSWSMAKSITHAAVGLLVLDGALDPSDPAPVPEWADDPRSAITTLQLLEMRSGLRFVEDYVDGDVSHCIEMLFGGTEPSFAHYAAVLPLDHEPGTVFNYSSGTSNIVSRIVGDLVTGVGGDPAERSDAIGRFFRTRLFEPVGMTTASPRFDGAGDVVGSSYVDATAADFARFGRLYLNDGVTGSGERILPEGWLDHAWAPITHDVDSGFGYGRHWWTWPWFPGSLACHGYEGQFTLVLPEHDLVAVHLGVTDAVHNRGLVGWLTRIVQAVLDS
ncbi:MAG: serine hydrolase [Actinomycetota bacterium]